MGLMNLNRLRLFLDVTRYMSVTKTSTALHVSRSAISHQLALLQSEHNAKLYNKVSGGIELTTAGQIFARRAKLILSQFDDLKERLNYKQIADTDRSLAVGGSYAPSKFALPAVLALFQKSHPNARITFQTKDSRTIERMVLRSEVEIGLVTMPSRARLLNVEPFSREEIVAFVAARHPLAKKSMLTLEELARARLVLRQGEGGEKGLAYGILQRLKRQGLKADPVMRCESLDAVRSLVEKGMWVGVSSRALVSGGVKEGKLKIVQVPELGMHVSRFIIYRKDRPLSPKAQDFLALLRANSPLAKQTSLSRSRLSPRFSSRCEKRH